MLKLGTISTVDAVFEEMQKSSFTFHLTGSRYFRVNVKPDSDWDFFTEYSGEVCLFLESLGFEQIPGSSYEDTNTIHVFERWSVFYSDIIHVQLVTGVKKKIAAQKALNVIYQDHPEFFSLPSQKGLWNLAFLAIEHYQNQIF